MFGRNAKNIHGREITQCSSERMLQDNIDGQGDVTQCSSGRMLHDNIVEQGDVTKCSS